MSEDECTNLRVGSESVCTTTRSSRLDDEPGVIRRPNRGSPWGLWPLLARKRVQRELGHLCRRTQTLTASKSRNVNDIQQYDTIDITKRHWIAYSGAVGL